MNVPQVTIEQLEQQTKYKYNHDQHITQIFMIDDVDDLGLSSATKIRVQWLGNHNMWATQHAALAASNPQTQPDTIYHYHNPEYPQNLINDIQRLK